MKRRFTTCWVALILGLAVGVGAEELWIKNRPFQGIVQGTGSTLLIELDEFLKEFGLTIEDQGDLILVEGFPIAVEQVGGKRLVLLRDLVDAAGLRLSRNVALGTVDVLSAEAGTGSSGDWASFDSSLGTNTADTPTRAKVLLEGEDFKVTIPGHLHVAAEETFVRTEDEARVAVRPAPSDYEKAQVLSSAFSVTTKEGFDKCSMSLALIPDLSEPLTADDEKMMLESAFRGARRNRSKIVHEIHAVNLAGQRYHSMRFLDVNAHGAEVENELYLQVNPTRKVAYLFLLTAERKLFNRVAPQLRLVLKTFRPKR